MWVRVSMRACLILESCNRKFSRAAEILGNCVVAHGGNVVAAKCLKKVCLKRLVIANLRPIPRPILRSEVRWFPNLRPLQRSEEGLKTPLL